MSSLFGNPHAETKRSLNDFFVVKPFSILDTMEQSWMRRRAWWSELIQNRGASREGVLFKKSKGEATKIGSTIQNFNNGVSLFDPVLSEAMVRWFSTENMAVLDPFAGDESRGFVSCYLNRSYTGFELRQEQVDLNKGRIEEAGFGHLCTYVCSSSVYMDKVINPESHDFVLTCPPYAFLEKYSDDPEDLSNMTVPEFFNVYSQILKQSYACLKNNRFAVIVVSEVRDRDGSYIGLVPKTIDIMEKAGFKYYNEIVLKNNVGTLRFRVGNSMNASRKVGRMHQNVLVFFKGDMSTIKGTYGKLIGLEEEG